MPAYDPKLKKTLTFGGFDEISYLRETWTCDGATWTKLSKDAASPKPRGLATMFWDPVSQRTIVYGGIGRPSQDDAVTRYGDMWAFDGTKWTEIKPATLPAIRYGAATGFNPGTNTVVMFGGKSALEEYLNEHWEWDGHNWKQLQPETLPSPRMNGAMAVNPTTGKLTMYGGYAGYYFQEVWTWSGGKWELVSIVGDRLRPARPQAGSDSNKDVCIEVRTEELDVAGGFDCIALGYTVGTAASIMSIEIYGLVPRYAAVSTTAWDEIVD